VNSPATVVGVKKSRCILKSEASLISQKTQDTDNIFNLPYVHLKAKEIFSRAFPDAVDNKEVISDDYLKWFSLRSDLSFSGASAPFPYMHLLLGI
jgi:hypothetical protein